MDVFRGAGCDDRRPVSFHRAVGERPVAGQLAGPAGRAVGRELRVRFELSGELLVQLASLTGRQLPLHDLSEQLVTEGVTAARKGDEDAVRRGLPKGGAHLAPGSFDDELDQATVDRPPRDGQRLDDGEGVEVERRDPTEQDLDE